MLLLSLLFLNLFLDKPLFLLLFSFFSLLFHLKHSHLFSISIIVLSCLFIHTSIVIISSTIIFTSCYSWEWSNSNIFTQKLLSGKIVHEIFSCNVSLIFTFFLSHNLFQLFTNSFCNFFKHKSQGLLLHFIIIGCNIFSKLLINFLNNSLTPSFDLIIDKIYFLLKLICFIFSLG